jgi:hypothetical protein
MSRFSTNGNSTESEVRIAARVARWFIFKPKIQIWANFGGPPNGKCWYRYFMTIWNILWLLGIIYDRSLSFGTFFQFWHFWTNKNLATLCQVCNKLF